MNEQLTGILSTITYGPIVHPIFVTIHGLDGVGKSTFGAGSPQCVFVGTEKGSYQLNVARFPQPNSLGEFLQQIDALATITHPFQSVVIDSLDWLEPLIHRQVCAEGKVNSIELYEKGFGKGYKRALEIWRGIIARFLALNTRFHVILIAHSHVKRFDDPDQPAGYDRYEIAVHHMAAAAIRQASDAVLFANYKTVVKNIRTEVGKEVGKAVADDARACYTQRRPAFDAKNRFNLPFELPLEWKAFGQAVKAFYDAAPVAEELTQPNTATEPVPQPPTEPTNEVVEPTLEPEPESVTA